MDAGAASATLEDTRPAQRRRQGEDHHARRDHRSRAGRTVPRHRPGATGARGDSVRPRRRTDRRRTLGPARGDAVPPCARVPADRRWMRSLREVPEAVRRVADAGRRACSRGHAGSARRPDGPPLHARDLRARAAQRRVRHARASSCGPAMSTPSSSATAGPPGSSSTARRTTPTSWSTRPVAPGRVDPRARRSARRSAGRAAMAYVDRVYRLRPGAEPGPMTNPIAWQADFDGYLVPASSGTSTGCSPS